MNTMEQMQQWFDSLSVKLDRVELDNGHLRQEVAELRSRINFLEGRGVKQAIEDKLLEMYQYRA